MTTWTHYIHTDCPSCNHRVTRPVVQEIGYDHLFLKRIEFFNRNPIRCSCPSKSRLIASGTHALDKQVVLTKNGQPVRVAPLLPHQKVGRFIEKLEYDIALIAYCEMEVMP